VGDRRRSPMETALLSSDLETTSSSCVDLKRIIGCRVGVDLQLESDSEMRWVTAIAVPASSQSDLDEEIVLRNSGC
jgi:hypothetical protein